LKINYILKYALNELIVISQLLHDDITR